MQNQHQNSPEIVFTVCQSAKRWTSKPRHYNEGCHCYCGTVGFTKLWTLSGFLDRVLARYVGMYYLYRSSVLRCIDLAIHQATYFFAVLLTAFVYTGPNTYKLLNIFSLVVLFKKLSRNDYIKWNLYSKYKNTLHLIVSTFSSKRGQTEAKL